MARKLFFVLLGLLTVYASYWLYQNFSWVEEQKEVGFQGIAKRKPLLAAEFFLRRMGVPNQSVNGLVAFRYLDSPRRSILIATRRTTINKELSDKLIQWVKSGGKLIVEARSCHRINDQAYTTQNQADFVYQLLGLCVNNITENDNEPVTIKVRLNNTSNRDMIELHFPYREVLKRQKQVAGQRLTWRIADKQGEYALQYALGDGLITVLVTTEIFTNDHIAEYDHARFLLELVQGNENEVWLVSVEDMPSLWRWLWDNAWYVMFSLSLLLLLWLWRYPLRFGPILPDQATQRRKLREHLQASAYYRWHYKQLPRLLAAVQEELWERMQKLYPVIQREKPQQAYALLAQISQFKQSEIQAAFEASETLNEKEFEQKITLLVKLKHLL